MTNCRAGFKDGNALVSIDGKACLVDMKGEVVVSPEKTGYTNSLLHILSDNDYNYKQAYYDGYFPVYKQTVDFSGKTTYEYGVLSTKGEWIVELSTEYFGNENPTKKEYYNGFLNVEDRWWNLRTGEFSYAAPEGIELYENRNLESVEGLKEKYPTIEVMGNFLSSARYTNAQFRATAGVYFFSLIGRDYELCFQPFEIMGSGLSFPRNNEMCGIADVDETGRCIYAVKKDGTLCIYDLDGTLKREFPALISTESTWVRVERSVEEEVYSIRETRASSHRETVSYFIDAQSNVILGSK